MIIVSFSRCFVYILQMRWDALARTRKWTRVFLYFFYKNRDMVQAGRKCKLLSLVFQLNWVYKWTRMQAHTTCIIHHIDESSVCSCLLNIVHAITKKMTRFPCQFSNISNQMYLAIVKVLFHHWDEINKV